MLKSKLQYGLMGVRSRNNTELKSWSERLEELVALSNREQVPLVIRPITHNTSNQGLPTNTIGVIEDVHVKIVLGAGAH